VLEELTLREALSALRRGRWWILGITAAFVALSLVYSATQRPVYEAAATLRIDENDASKNLLGNLAPLARVPGKVETEMLVLQSRRIAEAVVDSLGLVVQVASPEVPRSEVFEDVDVPRGAAAGRYELRRVPDGSYALHALGDEPERPLARTVVPGESLEVGGARLRLARGLAGGGVERIRFSVEPHRETVRGLGQRLTVFRPEIGAHVVGIRYTSSDPEIAAAVPNAVVANFLHFKLQGSKTESRSTVDFLRDQVAAYEEELRRAEDDLRAFRERARVVSPRDEAAEQVQRLARLQAERDQLRSERESLGRLLRVVESAGGTGTQHYRQLASFPVFLSNRAVQDILQALTGLENQRAAALIGRTEVHQEVRSLDERKRELELQLYEIARNYLSGLDTQIASADGSLQRFSRELETIPAREVEFARLSREQTLLAELYTLLNTRLKEAEILQAVEPSDIRVIDTAMVPAVPISPRPMRNGVIALLLGLLVGTSAAVGHRLMDQRVRSRDDVLATVGPLPVLGSIPEIRAEPPAGRFRLARRAATPVHEVITLVHPHAPASEAFRALRTNLTFSSAGEPPRIVVVTSAMPGEGKSTTSSNLAVTFARQGTRTVLVDADLRRGVLHTLFACEQTPGLSHLLVGRATLDEALREVATGDPEGEGRAPLSLLTTGVLPPNPAELLGSPRLDPLLLELKRRFEVIVIDAPPLNLVTDAAILSKHADSTLLVTRLNASDRRALHHAVSQLVQVSAPLTGVVLNGVDAASSYYGYAGNGYAPASPSANGRARRAESGAPLTRA
jgi:capsular exopolysaccharide synthesis family protein